MGEVMIKLKGTELGDRLQVDYISVDGLIRDFEDYICKVEEIKEELEDLKKDRWEHEEDKQGYYADMYYELEKLGE